MDNLQATSVAPVSSSVVQISEDERLFASLTYVPFLNLLTCPLAYVRKPDSEFCKFHIRQGFLLFGLWFISLFVLAIFPAIHPLFGGILSVLLWILLLSLSIIGGLHAWKGDQFSLPVVGGMAPHLHIDEFFRTVFIPHQQ